MFPKTANISGSCSKAFNSLEKAMPRLFRITFLVAWDMKEHLIFREPQTLSCLKAQCFKGVFIRNQNNWLMLLEWILSCFSLWMKSKEVQFLPSVRAVPYVTGSVNVSVRCEMPFTFCSRNQKWTCQQLHRIRL